MPFGGGKISADQRPGPATFLKLLQTAEILTFLTQTLTQYNKSCGCIFLILPHIPRLMQTYLYIGLGFSIIAVCAFLLVMLFPSVFGAGGRNNKNKRKNKG